MVVAKSFPHTTPFVSFFFEKYGTNASTHIHAHLLTYMNAHTHTLFLWAPPKDWAGGSGLDIDEVITDASLSMGTSPPTERIFHIYKTHGCQTWGLNSCGWGYNHPPNHPTLSCSPLFHKIKEYPARCSENLYKNFTMCKWRTKREIVYCNLKIQLVTIFKEWI
jgi:hypothetical protein